MSDQLEIVEGYFFAAPCIPYTHSTQTNRARGYFYTPDTPWHPVFELHPNYQGSWLLWTVCTTVGIHKGNLLFARRGQLGDL